MPLKPNPLQIFKTYFPPNAVEYCVYLWKTYNFSFKISKKRQSKLGDYRYTFSSQSHAITVNANLNAYAFLVTYIHEVAHLTTQLKHGSKPEPHGIEWKHEFNILAKPILNEQVFPTNVLRVFSAYLTNPKASSCADINLVKALQMHDEPDNTMLLANLSVGEMFILQDKKFRKDKVNRSRSICTDVINNKRYFVSNAAKVIHV